MFSLHRALHQADWETTPPGSRNYLQKLAKKTNGIVTPGNLISVAGLFLVGFGAFLFIAGARLEGTLMIVIGRLCDVVDGHVADLTQTKSLLGAKIDAVADKIAIAIIVIVFAIQSSIPLYYLALILLPHLLNSIVSLLAFHKNIPFYVSRLGKITTAIQWLSILFYFFAISLNADTTLASNIVIASSLFMIGNSVLYIKHLIRLA